MKLFFLHVPKCAGTTFKDVLYANYKTRKTAWIDGKFHEESTKKLISLPRGVRNNYKCIMGHFKYGLHTHFEGDFSYSTMLRDPIERVISLYYHIKRAEFHIVKENYDFRKISLLDFVLSDMSPEIDNCQTVYISGLATNETSALETAKNNLINHFPIVGTSENLRFSTALFLNYYQLKTPKFLPSRNVGVRPKKERIENFEEIETIIRSRNALDLELYKFANEELEKKIISEKEHIAKYVNELELAEDRGRCQKDLTQRIKRSAHVRKQHFMNRISPKESYNKHGLKHSFTIYN